MALSPRVLAAATSLSAEFTAGSGRLGRVAQVGGPPRSRLDCFASGPWRKMAGKLADPAVRTAALDLLDNRCPAVPTSDYDSWYYIDRSVLMGLSAAARQQTADADDRLVQLWLATMIWGHARDNRGPGKVLAALVACKDVVSTLRHSTTLLDAGNLAGAYTSCLPRSAGYLTGFGESFFTKWLWSAGLGAGLIPTTARVRRSGARCPGPVGDDMGFVGPQPRTTLCRILHSGRRRGPAPRRHVGSHRRRERRVRPVLPLKCPRAADIDDGSRMLRPTPCRGPRTISPPPPGRRSRRELVLRSPV